MWDADFSPKRVRLHAFPGFWQTFTGATNVEPLSYAGNSGLSRESHLPQAQRATRCGAVGHAQRLAEQDEGTSEGKLQFLASLNAGGCH